MKGIVYNPRVEGAEELAKALSLRLKEEGFEAWVLPVSEGFKGRAFGSELLITLGGDGTILRVFRETFPDIVPILGVNMGKLGFIAEVDGKDALEKVPELLREGIIEERVVFEAFLGDRFVGPALNEVVLARGRVPKLLGIRLYLDGEELFSYMADGMIVSTPTGSTGYSLACGGPIIHPSLDVMLVLSISPHLTISYPLILPGGSEVGIESTQGAVLSIDGQVDVDLDGRERLIVRRSAKRAKFLRSGRRKPFTRIKEKLARGRG